MFRGEISANFSTSMSYVNLKSYLLGKLFFVCDRLYDLPIQLIQKPFGNSLNIKAFKVAAHYTCGFMECFDFYF